MRISVHSKPNSRRAEVEELPDGLRVRIDAPAVDDRANRRLVEILAGHYGVPKSSVRIVSGRTGRRKIVELPG